MRKASGSRRRYSYAAKFDAKLAEHSARLDDHGVRFDAKLDGLRASISKIQAWAIALYVALVAGMFGTMARGFGWI